MNAMNNLSNFKPRTMDPENATILDSVCENTSVRLDAENGIIIKDHTGIFTIVVTFLEELASVMGDKARQNAGEASVELAKVLTFAVTNRDSDGEKTGNLVPVITPGEATKLRIKNDGVTEEKEEE